MRYIFQKVRLKGVWDDRADSSSILRTKIDKPQGQDFVVFYYILQLQWTGHFMDKGKISGFTCHKKLYNVMIRCQYYMNFSEN